MCWAKGFGSQATREEAIRKAPVRSRKSYIAARIRAVFLPLLALAGCQLDVLDPRGAVGTADATILIDSVAIMLAIVLPTIAAIFGFAFWFRKSNNRARYLPDWEYSGQIELVTWSIPALTIILLGGVTWIGSHELDPARPLASKAPPLEVQVVSLDWKWLFIYPAQKIASVNQLAIPAGVPVHFSLTSASVMNVFFVPRLGSMIYTMNGMRTQLYLIADTPGTFRGQSSHYSGDGFSGMHFDVQALPPDRFSEWIVAARAAGPSLDRAAYLALAAQSSDVRPFTYRAADAGLFAEIVSQTVPPGPGPADPLADVRPSSRAER
jgi:cytochrome o ubiquinol oxidase subunit II